MTPEELGQVIRDQISRAVSNALSSGVPSVDIMRRCEEEILRAVRQAVADLSATPG